MNQNIKIDPYGFREYDARWLYEKDINSEGITNLGRGLGTQIKNHTKKENPRVVVGHDYRSYSEKIKIALKKGNLYGIGYAAASIDCTAAAVLPFVVLLSTLGGSAITIGIGGLMIGLLILMVAVTMLVGLGRQVMINFLRRATGMIKLVGSWMMIMAGIGLTIYLTNQEAVALLFG